MASIIKAVSHTQQVSEEALAMPALQVLKRCQQCRHQTLASDETAVRIDFAAEIPATCDATMKQSDEYSVLTVKMQPGCFGHFDGVLERFMRQVR